MNKVTPFLMFNNQLETAIEFCRELTGVSDVIKLNRTEAELITGNSDLLTAANAVNAREIATEGLSGKAIGDALQRRRVAAIAAAKAASG